MDRRPSEGRTIRHHGYSDARRRDLQARRRDLVGQDGRAGGPVRPANSPMRKRRVQTSWSSPVFSTIRATSAEFGLPRADEAHGAYHQCGAWADRGSPHRSSAESTNCGRGSLRPRTGAARRREFSVGDGQCHFHRGFLCRADFSSTPGTRYPTSSIRLVARFRCEIVKSRAARACRPGAPRPDPIRCERCSTDASSPRDRPRPRGEGAVTTRATWPPRSLSALQPAYIPHLRRHRPECPPGTCRDRPVRL